MTIDEIRIRKLTREIEAYEQAIREAEAALTMAERELDEELDFAMEEYSPVPIN